MPERYTEPQPQTVELLRTGELLYWPDLTDPNTQDPNELVLHKSQQPSGFINTGEFFERVTVDDFTAIAPEPVAKAFWKLRAEIVDMDTPPGAVFLSKRLYNDFLTLTVFMSTGKVMTENDARVQVNGARELNLANEDMLVTVPAAIIGFAVTEKSGGKDGINAKADFKAFLTKLTRGDCRGTFSPLCAQYGSQVQPDGTIFAYKLLDNVAEAQIARTMRWQNMLTMVHQLKFGPITQLWSTIAGDADHIHSIVPKVIRQFAMENGIAKMFLLIDRHLSQLQQISNHNEQGITVTNLQYIEQLTEQTLISCFGQDWARLSKAQIDQKIYLLGQDEGNLQPEQILTLQLARIAMEDAFPGISRFAGQHRETAAIFENKAYNLDDDLANLTPEELAEWADYRGFTSLEDAQQFLALIRNKLIRQGEIGPAADAIHEVVLYFTMGAYAAQESLLVIGLDIDHDRWMSIAWQLGYNYTKNLLQKEPVPIIYARNPDTGKTDGKFSGQSYAEIYYQQRQFSDKPYQPLSQIPIGQYFAL